MKLLLIQWVKFAYNEWCYIHDSVTLLTVTVSNYG
jgi:hypothetical protein